MALENQKVNVDVDSYIATLKEQRNRAEDEEAAAKAYAKTLEKHLVVMNDGLAEAKNKIAELEAKLEGRAPAEVVDIVEAAEK